MEQREMSSATPVEACDTANTLEPVAATVTAETMKTDSDPAPEQNVSESPEPAEKSETRKPLDKNELVVRLEELSALDGSEIANEDVARIKQLFYQLHNEELRLAREAFVEAGGEAEAFVAEPDPLEEKAKALFQTIREKKAVHRAAIEAQLQANYDAKKEIVDKLREMSADTDNVNRLFPEVRELQARFKELGDVPDRKSVV